VKRYSWRAYLLGSLLRRRCTAAGALARLRGRPAPQIDGQRGDVRLGDDVGLYPGVRLQCLPGARLSIGSGSYLNRNTLVHVEREVQIGADVMVAWDVIISDTQGFGARPGTGAVRPVRIGDGVWIGAKAVVLGGADIGRGAVIAAGAVVDGRVAPGAIVAARPARQIAVLPGALPGAQAGSGATPGGSHA